MKPYLIIEFKIKTSLFDEYFQRFKRSFKFELYAVTYFLNNKKYSFFKTNKKNII